MRNRMLLASLLAVLGCGGGTAATDAVRADPALSAMLTELQASPRSELVAAGHDQIVVPAAVFGTTTDIVAWFSFVAIRDNGGDGA